MGYNDEVLPERGTLLSRTSIAKGSHTALSRAINKAPLITLDILRPLTRRAIRDVVSECADMHLTRRLVTAQRRLVDSATSWSEYLDSPDADAEPNTSFKNILLASNNQGDSQFDIAFQKMLTASDAKTFEDVDATHYLFRLATSEPEHNLIAELRRSNLGQTRVPIVQYELNFAGYDAD